MTACAKPNAGFTHALEISQRQRDSHIPTTPATILPKHKGKDQNQELSMGAVEKWKSKSRISTFPPPAQPAAQGKFPLPHRQGSATAKHVDSRTCLLRSWAASDCWPLGSHAHCVLDSEL